MLRKGLSAWERARNFPAGRHGTRVVGREVLAEASSAWQGTRDFGAGPALPPLLNLLSRYYPG